jgi:hypothetical protein
VPPAAAEFILKSRSNDRCPSTKSCVVETKDCLNAPQSYLNGAVAGRFATLAAGPPRLIARANRNPSHSDRDGSNLMNKGTTVRTLSPGQIIPMHPAAIGTLDLRGQIMIPAACR